MASASARFPSVADCLLLFQKVEERRHTAEKFCSGKRTEASDPHRYARTDHNRHTLR